MTKSLCWAVDGEVSRKACSIYRYKKAYDEVWRADLWATVRGKLLESIKALYKESKACVRVEGDGTEEFVVEQGLSQGCPLSP